ncbi:hypothetical protein KR054_011083, partial [Drosophila jambulina]
SDENGKIPEARLFESLLTRMKIDSKAPIPTFDLIPSIPEGKVLFRIEIKGDRAPKLLQ